MSQKEENEKHIYSITHLKSCNCVILTRPQISSLFYLSQTFTIECYVLQFSPTITTIVKYKKLVAASHHLFQQHSTTLTLRSDSSRKKKTCMYNIFGGGWMMNGLSRRLYGSMRAIDSFPVGGENCMWRRVCRTVAHVPRRQEQAEKTNIPEHSTQGQSGFTTHLDNTSHILLTSSRLSSLTREGLFSARAGDDRVDVWEGGGGLCCNFPLLGGFVKH